MRASKGLCKDQKLMEQLQQLDWEAPCVQSTDYAATIRRTFQYEGLQGAVEALPLEKRFKLSNVKDVRPTGCVYMLMHAARCCGQSCRKTARLAHVQSCSSVLPPKCCSGSRGCLMMELYSCNRRPDVS